MLGVRLGARVSRVPSVELLLAVWACISLSRQLDSVWLRTATWQPLGLKAIKRDLRVGMPLPPGLCAERQLSGCGYRSHMTTSSPEADRNCVLAGGIEAERQLSICVDDDRRLRMLKKAQATEKGFGGLGPLQEAERQLGTELTM